MADTIRDWLFARYTTYECLGKCESPIERLFGSAFMFMGEGKQFPGGEHYRMETQHKTGDYRLDFLFVVTCADGAKKRLAVELDGHDFHEKTKQQAARDKKRDRDLLGEGIEVMRFTGSEVWANPFACVDEALTRCHVLRYGKTPREATARAHLDAIRDMLDETPEAGR